MKYVMRKDPFDVGSFVHVTQRGARGMPIVRDDSDRWRFLRILRYFNDENVPRQWERDLDGELLKDNFARPQSWEPADPLVRILAFCLLDNHFHLLLEEIKDFGVTRFMKRVGDSMAGHFNKKYRERGGLFQGAYRARRIVSTEDLLHVAAYIQIKNVLDCVGWQGVYEKAFTETFKRIVAYPYGSLPEYAGTRSLPVIDKGVLGDIWGTSGKVEVFAKDFIDGREHLNPLNRHLWCE